MTQPLTPEQHALFFRLIQHERDGELFGHIVPVPISASRYVVYLSGTENLLIRSISDLETLAEVGLLSYQLSRMGTAKHYFLTDEARKAAATGMLDGESFTRLDYVSQESKLLKAQLAELLSAENYAIALMEMNFVNNLLDSRTPDKRSIRVALQKIDRLINVAFESCDLVLVTRAITTFGRWSQAVTHLL